MTDIQSGHIYQTVALVAALGNIEHRLDELVTYIASIEGKLSRQ